MSSADWAILTPALASVALAAAAWLRAQAAHQRINTLTSHKIIRPWSGESPGYQCPVCLKDDCSAHER